MEQKYVDYMLKQLENLLKIKSPTGYSNEINKYLVQELTDIGYEPNCLHKGGVTVNMGGGTESPIMLFAHVDTLGGVVSSIKGTGRLMISPLGGLVAANVETETVTVVTRDGREYEGTIQVENASSHVNRHVATAERKFDTNIEVVLDEFVKSAQDTLDLGIQNGDIIAVNPRFVLTSKGYIKSRFLDDKASSAVLLTFAKYVKEEKITLARNVWLSFTMYEEVGHGGAAGVPDSIKDVLAVDMGCVGGNLKCTEQMVSICAKDSGGPYNYDFITELMEAAKKANLDYALDVYPYYGSDVETTLRTGKDVRHGLIGPGVYASHGYERTHVDGLKNTLALIISYLA